MQTISNIILIFQVASVSILIVSWTLYSSHSNAVRDSRTSSCLSWRRTCVTTTCQRSATCSASSSTGVRYVMMMTSHCNPSYEVGLLLVFIYLLHLFTQGKPKQLSLVFSGALLTFHIVTNMYVQFKHIQFSQIAWTWLILKHYMYNIAQAHLQGRPNGSTRFYEVHVWTKLNKLLFVIVEASRSMVWWWWWKSNNYTVLLISPYLWLLTVIDNNTETDASDAVACYPVYCWQT